MARPPQIALDRDRVRAAIRALPAEYVRYMLPDAVELLAPARLHAVARQYLDLRRLRPESRKAHANLLRYLVRASGAPRRGPRRRRFLRRRAGAWLVGVDWKTALPPWFNVLSATAQADEYTRRITGLLERHCGDETDRMLVVAQKITTPAQRQTLDRVRRTRGTRR